MPDQELERFKIEIDLGAFAASRGYERDKVESSQNCDIMRNTNGDKIAVIQHTDEKGAVHWVYYCIRDARDNGSIIDFLKWRGGGSLGQIRKTLREWSGAKRCDIPEFYQSRKMRPVSKDRAAVLIAWGKARAVRSLSYLTARGLGPAVLDLPAFAGCVRVDARGNALFPHYDREGLCGYEIKNQGFTGFSAGGIKGLWYSKAAPSARVLAFCESAIDAISFHVLNPAEELRAFSVGGALNGEQPDLIRSAMEKAPSGSLVLLAFDADEGGDHLADQVRDLAPPSVEVRRALPPVGMGKDWNETLKHQRGIVDRATTSTVAPDHGKTPPADLVQGAGHRKKAPSGPHLGNRGRNRR